MKRFLMLPFLLMALVAQAVTPKDNDMFSVSTSGWDVTVNTTIPGKTYANAGIKINTPGYELSGMGVQCNGNQNGYCTFSVSDTSAATLSVIGKSGNFSMTLCLNGSTGQSCQEFTQRLKIAYITNYAAFSFAGSVAECAIKSNGFLDVCQNAGDGAPIDGPTNIVLNTLGTMAYIVNYNASSLLVCPMNNLGEMSTCIQEYVFPTGFDYSGEALTPSGNALLVTNNDTSKVERCPIQANGTLDACTDTGATGINNPYGIILNQAGTLAWVANRGFPGSVTVCAVNDGMLSSCQDSGYSFSGLGPQDFGLNPAETYIYVSNSSTVLVCGLNVNGTFSGCTDALPGGPFTSGVWGIRVNQANTQAYVTDFDGNTTYVCAIKTDGSGEFDACNDSGQLFSGPSGITIRE